MKGETDTERLMLLVRKLADLKLARDRLHYLALYERTALDPAEKEFYAQAKETARERIEASLSGYSDLEEGNA